MLHKPLLVIKVGTHAITDRSGNLRPEIMLELVTQLVKLHKTHRLVLVSSGAIGCGKNLIPKYSKKVAEQKAAAAIGNPLLLHHYQTMFNRFSQIPVAQALCEKHHFSDRASFLQLWETFQALWKAGAIPIANENDVVCDYEIRFSDNDELATMIACGFSAAQLLLGTAVEGILDKNGKVIPKVETFSDKLFEGVTKDSSTLGRGGMINKIQCAKKTCEMGCEVVIFDARKPGNLLKAHKHETGTVCRSQLCSLSAHRRWISMGGKISGKVIVDSGAAKALQNRKSLLLVGVQTVEGEFERGDLLEIYEEGRETPVGLGRAHMSASEIVNCTDKKGQELVRTDELVLSL